jgi:hypothetical protein
MKRQFGNTVANTGVQTRVKCRASAVAARHRADGT